MRSLRHFIFDIIGIALILISPLLGWLPGPGGIPLLLAGLGFLSIHHDWAKKLIKYIRNNGLKISEKIFIEHPALQALYDMLSFTFLAGGIYLLLRYTKSITLSLAIFCLFTGATLFLGNRKRLELFIEKMKKILR